MRALGWGLWGAGAALLIWNCGVDFSRNTLGTEINIERQQPGVAAALRAPRYTGDDEHVLNAQNNYPTGFDMQQKIIIRTCAVTEGVCHNRAEYPDLHSPANLLSAVGAPCNVQSGDYTGIFDRCELQGDEVRIDGDSDLRSQVGYIELVPGDWIDYSELGTTPDVASPGLHITLRNSLSHPNFPRQVEVSFIRRFELGGTYEEIVINSIRLRWWLLDEGKRLYGEVRPAQVDSVERLLAVGVQQGDANRNGIFGASQYTPLSLIVPGRVDRSYLIGRLRGIIPPEQAEPGAEEEAVPGTLMPLANEPLSIADMLAVLCWIQGLPENPAERTLASDINYRDCTFSEDPENLNLLGVGTTWRGRVRPLLQGTCGGSACHGGNNPQGSLDLFSDEDESMYHRIVGVPSAQRPDLNLIEPGEPFSSYLFLKLIGEDPDPENDIVGAQMPSGGAAGLSQSSIDDIRAWIERGALIDE